MVEIELLRCLRGLEFAHLLHEGPVAVDQRDQGLLARRPFQILTVAACPFPGVVHIENCLHVALPQFNQEAVEADQQRVIVHAGGSLQGRFDAGIDAVGAITAHQYPEIVDAQSFQGVEFLPEAGDIPSPAFGGKYGSVPEVGADKRVGFSVPDEMSVFDSDKRGFVRSASGKEKGQDAPRQSFENRFHGQAGLDRLLICQGYANVRLLHRPDQHIITKK